ncbi:AAA family ATPase [Clostridium gasigenes]|uniref:AAA domain-containing protein n=1 Tax=Clostridium gasigenes TaxID=94869 RepID=UPI001438620E|nr:AAA domain-containing protein [Clostridium gasigenes]NKF08760.1 AAA family ATPase [Clostridium gasigenes]QSW19625.1 AAA family ATPase [Clostridium gasigenes]
MSIHNNGRIVELFKFLKEYNNIKNPVITDIESQVWKMWMDNIDENKYITNNIYNNLYENDVIFSVDKSDRAQCPEPPINIQEWLVNGWQLLEQDVKIIENKKISNVIKNDDGEEIEQIEIIKFEEDKERVDAYEKWKKLRDEWVKVDKEAKVAEDIFNEFYSLYAILKKDSESLELIIGDAILYCNCKKKLEHPILIQSVKIEFDANIPRFSLIEEDRGPQLYKNLFGYIEDYNHELVSEIYKEFDEEQYVPYEKEISNQFLNRLVHGLSPKGKFVEDKKNLNGIEKYPKIYRRPVIFLRKRNLGFGVAIDSIIDELDTNTDVPDFLNDVVGIETKERQVENNNDEVSKESALLATNGVDEEILLTKPANLEQLSVAKHLKRNSAVLVQGPPGTGKTHTISNIIGHLLSEGKSILVTSYSEKALSVLKDKVDPNLQALCLSLLSGVDSRREMEITLDEINANRANLEPSTLRNKIRYLEEERKNTIKRLSVLQIELKNARTNEYRPIVVGGQEYRPSDAAKYIKQNELIATKIATPIVLGEELTLTEHEIKELYLSNKAVTVDEEKEFDSNLPDISELITPSEFKVIINEKNKFDNEKLIYGKEFWVSNLNEGKINELLLIINEIKEILNYIKLDDEWILETIEVAREDDKKLWEGLLSEIENNNKLYTKCNEFILKYDPEFINLDRAADLEVIFTEIITKLQSGGKISKLTLMINKSMKNLINSCRVNGNIPSTLEEFKGLYDYYVYSIECNKIKMRWDRQVSVLGGESSSSMGIMFEKTTLKYSSVIKENLKWYEEKWNPLLTKFNTYGLDISTLVDKVDISSDRYSNLKYIKLELGDKVINLIEAEIHRLEYNDVKANKDKLEAIIKEKCEGSTSVILSRLKGAVVEEDIDTYEKCYDGILEIKKLGAHIERRRELLSKLKIVASEWARLIENRIGEFGENNPFANIKESWLCTQLIEEIDSRNKVSIDMIQNDILLSEKLLRENTSKLAFNKAWVSMIEKLSNNKAQIQAIEGWRQLIRKIGAGKGKNAEKYKNEARKLMPKCQGAIPVWIMPLNKVVENFNPQENKFDVVIIDEASQADIMAIVALYLGKQVIIVGDNEQVSPLAVGEKIDEIDRLAKEFLSDIPNKSLYSGKFSIYDLAQTSGYQPVRLKEHFRCVPEIIQFSNMLSYNNQIKALRETSNVKTKPPIITYRVENAVSLNKINEKEAEVITSLILSCCEKPQYNGKSFGVITLRGDKQATIIDRMLQSKMTPKEYNERNILCGNSAQFQGDERDIIFLSMVDANDNVVPMRLTGYGTDDSNKKRYNVAVSRAKDQLWLIHSIDVDNDLKIGDIRKVLLDYCNNYTSRQVEYEKNVVKAESVFEKMVMKYLIERGYNIVPQWEVGSYRIDMVAVHKGNKVAIECDGEKWHGDDKLMEDMNRQAILERLGWRFIRIRGSEFFRNEATAMDTVVNKLNSMEIYTEDINESKVENQEEVVSQIISNASLIRNSWEDEK